MALTRPGPTPDPEPSGPRLGRAARSLPGLARVAGAAALHTTEWGLRTSVRTGLRVARVATRPEEAGELVDDLTETVGAVADLARSVSAGTPVGRALMEVGQRLGGLVDDPDRPDHAERDRHDRHDRHDRPNVVDGVVVGDRTAPPSLREQGQDLLRRSRDVWADDQGHPAYGRILTELAPDEGRILLLLLEGGPQPSVDVRTGGPVGMVNSQLVAPGLTMIGGRAGCRHLDQVPAYLNNLFRLGLVWFSREALRDPMDYQVLEAQPDVLAALHSVRFTKVVRRSIHLTPFGEDFCRTCLVEESSAGDAFPEHATPSTDDGTPASGARTGSERSGDQSGPSPGP